MKKFFKYIWQFLIGEKPVWNLTVAGVLFILVVISLVTNRMGLNWYVFSIFLIVANLFIGRKAFRKGK